LQQQFAPPLRVFFCKNLPRFSCKTDRYDLKKGAHMKPLTHERKIIALLDSHNEDLALLWAIALAVCKCVGCGVARLFFTSK
jgi:hypothetical protein